MSPPTQQNSPDGPVELGSPAARSYALSHGISEAQAVVELRAARQAPKPAIPTREEIVILAAAAFDAKLAYKDAAIAYEAHRTVSSMGVRTAEMRADSEIRSARLSKTESDAHSRLQRAELALKRAAYLHANGVPLPE